MKKNIYLKPIIYLCILSVSLSLISCSPNQESNKTTETKLPNGITIKEFDIAYDGIKYANEIIKSKLNDLVKDKILKNTYIGPSSENYIFLRDYSFELNDTETLKSVSIKNGTAVTRSRNTSNLYHIVGNIIVNDREYIITYCDGNGYPSLLINGVTVF